LVSCHARAKTSNLPYNDAALLLPDQDREEENCGAMRRGCSHQPHQVGQGFSSYLAL